MRRRALALAAALVVGAPLPSYAGGPPAALQGVMRGVQHDLHYRFQTNVTRKWRVEPADHEGDCVSYALTTASRLERAGFAPDRLRVLILAGYGAEEHMVVLVDGQWVADSMSPWVEPLAAYDRHPILASYAADMAIGFAKAGM